MRFASSLLKQAIYPALHYSGYLNRITPPGCPVVNYHGLIPADHTGGDKFLDGNLLHPQTFIDQIRFLKSHYRIVHPEEFRASIEHSKPLPPRSILITCDDGLLNTLTDMLPILQDENVPCLFFVTAGSCAHEPSMLWYEELYLRMKSNSLNGVISSLPDEESGSHPRGDLQANWWSAVRRASQLNALQRVEWLREVRAHSDPLRDGSQKRWNLLESRELQQLANAGFTIGCHTRTHPVLSRSSEEEARKEIQQSRVELERTLNRTVWALAYPFGNPSTVGEREFCLAEEAGYCCAFLNVEQWPTPRSGAFALPRIHVSSDTTVPELAAHLSGFHSRLQRALSR